MSATLHDLAALLRRLRSSGRTIPIGAAEALLLIGAGIDSVPDLAAAMGNGDTPLPPASVNRLVSLLRGRARYSRGEWIESPFGALICVRPHPHRRGLQLVLSDAGAQLLAPLTSGQYKPTTVLALPHCAPMEEI